MAGPILPEIPDFARLPGIQHPEILRLKVCGRHSARAVHVAGDRDQVDVYLQVRLFLRRSRKQAAAAQIETSAATAY